MQDKRNGGMEEREKFEGGKEGATKKEKSEQSKRKRLTLTEACGERKEGLIVAGHLHLLRSLKQTPPPPPTTPNATCLVFCHLHL